MVSLKLHYIIRLTVEPLIHCFRVTGNAGKWIRNSCSPSYSCGSHGGIWTDAAMPTVIGQPVLLPLYGSWAGDCAW